MYIYSTDSRLSVCGLSGVRIIQFADYPCGLFLHFYRLGNHYCNAYSEFGSCF